MILFAGSKIDMDKKNFRAHKCKVSLVLALLPWHMQSHLPVFKAISFFKNHLNKISKTHKTTEKTVIFLGRNKCMLCAMVFPWSSCIVSVFWRHVKFDYRTIFPKMLVYGVIKILLCNSPCSVDLSSYASDTLYHLKIHTH